MHKAPRIVLPNIISIIFVGLLLFYDKIMQHFPWIATTDQQEKVQLEHPDLEIGLKIGKDYAFVPLKRKEMTKEEERKIKRQFDVIAEQIVNVGNKNGQLKNEIFCQLIKQTTIGEQSEKQLKPTILQKAVRRGWHLIMLCCERFSPLHNFEKILLAHFDKALDVQQIQSEGLTSTMQEDISMYAVHSYNKLIMSILPRNILKVDEKTKFDIEKIRNERWNFDCELNDIMLRQSILPSPEKDFLVPSILIFLTNKIIQTDGLKTEGIFRKCVPIDEAENAIALLDLGDYNNQFFKDHDNPHLYAVLLMNWFYRLWEPIIPFKLYDDALNIVRPSEPNNDDNIAKITSCQFILSQLPLANILTLKYISRFLKYIYAGENVRQNKMPLENLALIFAPNLIRQKSKDPTEMNANLHLEIAFIRTVMLELSNLPIDWEDEKFEQSQRWIYDNYCKSN
ncbi:MAG: putative Rho GTPase-activating protein 39 [Streblomastix strix]|uniref:Putative Rho GTPase-activating protein 39 n=1 Tax=Streblomastix strix TaxID=222440 RepID=A0A5J4UUQ0_9EUKA|nr:MAG: putative Rho GTPase-activating protein 39 [Streblomastix strix]